MYAKCSSLLELITLLGDEGSELLEGFACSFAFSSYSVKIIMFLSVKSQHSIQGRCQRLWSQGAAKISPEGEKPRDIWFPTKSAKIFLGMAQLSPVSDGTLGYFWVAFFTLQVILCFLRVNFLFWTFYFVVGYSRLAMLWQFQVNSKGTQPYIHMYLFSPQNPSYPGCHILLSRVHVLYNRPLLVIHSKYSSVYMAIPNSLTTLSSPGNHKFIF